MTAARWLVLAACGSPPPADKPPVPPPPPPAPVRTLAAHPACAVSGPWRHMITSGPWAHDLAPGCPPMPFEYDYWVCGDDCARPCRQTVTPRDGEPSVVTFSYDARGRWIRSHSADANNLANASCTYDGDHVATSTARSTAGLPRDLVTTLRYEGGRLVAISGKNDEDQDTDTTLAYDAAGRLVHASAPDVSDSPHPNDHDQWFEQTLAYDDRGRLTRVAIEGRHLDIESTYRYDAAGRVVERKDVRNAASATVAFAYDAKGLLARVTTTPLDDNGWFQPGELAFEYDDTNRLVRVTDERGTTTKYDYQCR